MIVIFCFSRSFVHHTNKSAPLQSNPSPLNPVIQVHTKLPCAFVQPANSLQFPLFTAHSSMSEVHIHIQQVKHTNFSTQSVLTKDVKSVDTGKSVPTVLYRPVSPNSKMWHFCYYKRDIDRMRLDSNVINWAESVKYLGVHVVRSRKLSFETQVFRRSFYAAFNNIRSHAKSLDELVQLSLC